VTQTLGEHDVEAKVAQNPAAQLVDEAGSRQHQASRSHIRQEFHLRPRFMISAGVRPRQAATCALSGGSAGLRPGDVRSRWGSSARGG
jgi:hypothetical protein